MLASIIHKGVSFKVDFFKPIDLSIAATVNEHSLRAWYQPPMKRIPVVSDSWVGSVAQGGSVNFNDLHVNPHAHCTHTESAGHISKDFQSVHNLFDRYFFLTTVCTLLPHTTANGDMILRGSDLDITPSEWPAEALIIRTLSNGISKINQNYSNTNPPYLDELCISKLDTWGIEHLLIDLPSVDRESDGGALARHKQFWNYPMNSKSSKTITELVYVPNSCPDGNYLLELQIAPIENDASPSRPVLYSVF
ncbi:MAG: hypothetical protein RIR05_454 [Bacteroidota bacterium]|jgi:arylformamidase|nr:cyclase family protein [Bacteroidia bacterium]NBY10188.1 cyclase family protein [Sphingobacteriia bacterium]